MHPFNHRCEPENPSLNCIIIDYWRPLIFLKIIKFQMAQDETLHCKYGVWVMANSGRQFPSNNIFRVVLKMGINFYLGSA